MKHKLICLLVLLPGLALLGLSAMAQDISLEGQRPADFVFSGHVERRLSEIRAAKPGAQTAVAAE